MTLEANVRENIILDKKDFIRIEPKFTIPPNYNIHNFNSYTASIENLVETIIPENIFDKLNNNTQNLYHSLFLELSQLLPLFSFSTFNTPPFCLSFSFLCSADYAQGIERFIPDMLSRWLIPGRQVILNGSRSLQFTFKHFKSKNFYVAEYFINIANEKQLHLIQKNLPSFIDEMKIIILSVHHARHIVSQNKLSLEQKSLIIKENLSSLLNRKSNAEHTVFDQMQDFLVKLSHEKKLSEIKENIAYLMYKRPQIDRDIFNSVHNVSLIFKGNYASKREPRHISRIIAYQYLFKKSLKQILPSAITKRHVFLKLLKAKNINSSKSALGILVVMNLLHENEHYEKSYILDAISSIIKDFTYVENSYLIDHRDDKMLSFYLEIEKTNTLFFLFEEIKALRNKLPEQFKERMKNVLNPVFLPRNEEEVLRNIIVLAKQLKYVRDLPQVIISYEAQKGKAISFHVILLRLLKKNTQTLKELFSRSNSPLKFLIEEVKVVGELKKKYPKEANIFKISVIKYPFARRDYSLDLRNARLYIVKELKKVLGDFRDFNGGMISKQCEALDYLKKSFHNLKKAQEFLLENFFYSIRPGIMQSILDTALLKAFFMSLLDLIKQDFNKNKYLIKTLNYKKHFFIIIGAVSFKYKEEIIFAINKLKFPSFELTSSSLDTNEVKTLGYIFQSTDEDKKQKIYNTILKALRKVR